MEIRSRIGVPLLACPAVFFQQALLDKPAVAPGAGILPAVMLAYAGTQTGPRIGVRGDRVEQDGKNGQHCPK